MGRNKKIKRYELNNMSVSYQLSDDEGANLTGLKNLSGFITWIFQIISVFYVVADRVI